jgi:hypothetical protein
MVANTAPSLTPAEVTGGSQPDAGTQLIRINATDETGYS